MANDVASDSATHRAATARAASDDLEYKATTVRAVAAAAAAALGGEQRVALAALGRVWPWAPAAVAGIGKTALGGAGVNTL